MPTFKTPLAFEATRRLVDRRHGALTLVATALALPALLSIPSTASAQGAAAAEARARLVCGSGSVVSATYLPGGMLQATCSQSARPAAEGGNQLGTGGLTTGPAAAAVIAGTVLVIGSSGSDSDTTVTTTGTAYSN